MIMIRVGISGVGVFLGSRCFKEVEGWFCRFVSKVVSYSGRVKVMFIDSWVVGVKV